MNLNRRWPAQDIAETAAMVLLFLLTVGIVGSFALLTFFLTRGATGAYTDDTAARILFGVNAAQSGLLGLSFLLKVLIELIDD